MAKSQAEHLASLRTIRDNLVTELATETAYRATNGPKPTYTAGDKTTDWSGYLTTMQKLITELNQTIAALSWGVGGLVETTYIA
jgi:hypothetical protein